MDELFDELIRITQGAADQAGSLHVDELNQLMRDRMQIIANIRKLDAQLPDGAPERLRYRDQVANLQKAEAIILQRMVELKTEASEQLGRFNDYHKQKDAYAGDEVDYDGYYFDAKR